MIREHVATPVDLAVKLRELEHVYHLQTAHARKITLFLKFIKTKF